jgi:hypothetical protein
LTSERVKPMTSAFEAVEWVRPGSPTIATAEVTMTPLVAQPCEPATTIIDADVRSAQGAVSAFCARPRSIARNASALSQSLYTT